MSNLPQEGGRIHHQTHGLKTAPIAQLGRDGRIDVYAYRRNGSGEEIARRDGMQGGGHHEG